MDETQTIIVDFGRPDSKARLWAVLRSLKGKIRIEWCKYRKRRTDRQNRFYHPCFVQPLMRFLIEQGEPATHLTAHEILKHKFLRASWIGADGEVHDYTRSTTELTTVQFNEYLDQCAAWLASYCDIQVPSPDVYHEREESSSAGKAA